MTITDPNVRSLCILTGAEILERYGRGNLLDAVYRFGRAHPAGAIVVDLWRRRGTIRVH